MNLEQFSTELEQLVERVSGSVVAVQAGGSAISGTVVKPEHILTIHHVLERNDAVNIVTADGALTGEVVGRDRRSDLALVRVPGLNAKPLEASHGAVKPGAFNLIVARTMRGNLEVAQGVIAFTTGSLEMGRGRFKLEGLLRSTAASFSGISGAPLIGASGALLGIVNGSFSNAGAVGLPAAKLLEVAVALEGGSGLKRGYLGVGVQPVRTTDDRRALLVNSVEAGGPAAVAGVLIGDVLLKLGEQPLERMEDLVTALSQVTGRAAQLEFSRGGQALSVHVTVTERAKSGK